MEAAVPLADMQPHTFRFAEDMAKLSPTSLATAKEMIKTLARDPDMSAITNHTALMRRCLAAPDFREGVQAFKEKRQPTFGAS